jgi:hypothetical protein
MEVARTIPEIITATATVAVAVIALWQLTKFTNQIKADFTYRIYKDLLDWLKDHKQAREWIFNPAGKKLKLYYDKWEFDDFLGYFVALWSLKEKKLVDKKIIYDLLSDYLISAYEANDKELKSYIEQMRKDERKPDLYIEINKLYEEMKNYEKRERRK